MRIKDLISRSKALIEGNVYLAVDDATNNVTQKIDYKTLAQEIIEQYNLSTLAGSAQSVKAALDGIKTDLNVVYGANSIKTLAATDDLLTLDVGMYRVANVLPLNAPSTTYKYGYATKQHRGASGYTYYEFIVGNGNGNDFKRYYGWQYSNSAASIDWIEMAPQSAVDALNSNFRRYVVSTGENTYEVGTVSFVFIGQSSNSARIFMYSNSTITNLVGSADSYVVVSPVDSTHIKIANSHTWNLRMLVLGMR